MHTLEKQCVARQLQSKFQRNAIKISILAFALLLSLPAFVFGTNTCFVNCYPFCFVAMHTLENQCVARQLQSKFQRNANKISTLAFALLLCLPAFIFGTNACFANCFFVWLPCGCSQLCVCKVLSDICCFHHVGTLLRRHFAFLTMHFCCFTTQQIRFSYLLLSSTFQRQKIAFVIFFASQNTCALKKRFAYCLVLGRIFPQA